MKSRASHITLGRLAAAALLLSAGLAHGAATIINPAGTVALGVKDTGALNTDTGNVAVNSSFTGLSYKFPDPDGFRDATSPGCLCEGWGVSATRGIDSFSGYDGTDNGFANLTVDSFVSTTTTATSSVYLTSLEGLKVTHEYSPAVNAPTALFRSLVTITNDTGATLNDVRYVRVMDWDVPPTEFDEYVTIKGTETTTLLERSHNNGFNSPDPLGGDASLDASTEDTDFFDYFSANNGGDQGAYFRFNFGSLANGESYSFTIFYGAAADEDSAIAAIAAEGIELYSLGQSSNAGLPPVQNDSPTFIFGFSGVGGTPVEPPNPAPEPASLALVGLGLAAMGALRRRRGGRRAA